MRFPFPLPWRRGRGRRSGGGGTRQGGRERLPVTSSATRRLAGGAGATSGRRVSAGLSRRGARPATAGRRAFGPRARSFLQAPRPGRTRAVRAAALLVLLASIGLAYGAVTSSAFALARIELPSLRWTPPDAVAGALQVAPGRNVFRIATAPIEARLRALPAVSSAHVRVALPDRLVVDVAERTPIVGWRVGDRVFLVDRDGRLFAAVAAADAAVDVPVVTDTRAVSATALAVGQSLDPVDLEAARRLGSLAPRDVGSTAQKLAVSVSDESGFVVRALPDGWTAIFGFYTPTLRRPDLIPGQVRLLSSLLAGREGGVAQVILADDRNGTYVPRPPVPTSAPPASAP